MQTTDRVCGGKHFWKFGFGPASTAPARRRTRRRELHPGDPASSRRSTPQALEHVELYVVMTDDDPARSTPVTQTAAPSATTRTTWWWRLDIAPGRGPRRYAGHRGDLPDAHRLTGRHPVRVSGGRDRHAGVDDEGNHHGNHQHQPRLAAASRPSIVSALRVPGDAEPGSTWSVAPPAGSSSTASSRIRLSVSGAIHVTATVTRRSWATCTGRATGSPVRSSQTIRSFWQAIEVNASNFEVGVLSGTADRQAPGFEPLAKYDQHHGAGGEGATMLHSSTSRIRPGSPGRNGDYLEDSPGRDPASGGRASHGLGLVGRRSRWRTVLETVGLGAGHPAAWCDCPGGCRGVRLGRAASSTRTLWRSCTAGGQGDRRTRFDPERPINC